MKKILFILIVLAAVGLFCACDEDVARYDDGDPIFNPPAGNEEAALMALWYGAELYIDETLFNRFKAALHEMRNKFEDSIEHVNISFMYPVSKESFAVHLTEEAVEQYRNGDYHAWDSLNKVFEVYEIDTLFYFGIFKSAYLHYNRLANPLIVKDMYAGLNGVEFTEPNGLVGDWPCTYPWIFDDKVTFLVRHAYGDCPSGCIYSEYYYFQETDTGMAYLGGYIPCYDPPHPEEPEWWEEAKIILDAYHMSMGGELHGNLPELH